MAIKLFSVTWSTDTAGPSPFNNKRTEVFLKGCKRAREGNPCKGCFNAKLWDDFTEFSYSANEMSKNFVANSPNKYITIGGGEPLDQIDDLIILTKLLKEEGFHIMVYTWRRLLDMIKDKEFKDKIFLLLENIDILADGSYDETKRLYKSEAKDGFLSSVGSANQIIWDTRYSDIIGIEMGDLNSIKLDENDNLIFNKKENYKEYKVTSLIKKGANEK